MSDPGQAHDHEHSHDHVQGAAPHSHMKDFEGHVRAVEEDLEYYRTKRFEPRVFLLHRRGIVTFYDILRAAREREPVRFDTGEPRPLELRIRALEDALDDYIRGQGLVYRSVRGVDLVVDDTRKERGDYDAFFRIVKRKHGGTLQERVDRLEEELAECLDLLNALTQALITLGHLSQETLDRARARLLDRSEWNGGKIVARAWLDPEFKQRLLANGREAVRELGIPSGRLARLGVAENTDTVHNVVVCTLCSCYPYELLGDTPWWYKHESYRGRIIREPRATMQEMFDFQPPEGMEVRVHDSTSDVRWMVLPRRPAGTEGLSEEELALLVTQESLIGVAEPLQPGQVPAEPRVELTRR